MIKLLRTLPLIVLINGCDSLTEESSSSSQHKLPPLVRMVEVGSQDNTSLQLSGTLRGRYETPVAFQVPGRILTRNIDAGQQVQVGQLLFQLDKRDLLASVKVAEAGVETAEAALAIADSELQRQKQLVEKDFVSQQTLGRFELALREANSHRRAAEAALNQAKNALSYADLHAERSGILAEVSGEPGQVVAIGQPVARLVEGGTLEVEVYLPDGTQAPKAGSVSIEQRSYPISLREVAGAADSQSRSWRARYRIDTNNVPLYLGSVVQVNLTLQHSLLTLTVPLGALDERNNGSQIWQVINGHAQPLPVDVLALGPEYAEIRASLNAGSRIIAIGTHLLTPGMPVREQSR